MFPRQSSREPRAQAQTEVLMDYQDHLALRGEIVNTAQELALLQLPDRFHTELTGIHVVPDVPYALRRQLGWDYNRLSFGSERLATPDENDAFMGIWLHGPTRDQQVQITANSMPVEYGKDKQFSVTPYGSTRPTTFLIYEDVGLLLDFILPDTQNRFIELTDCQQQLTFDEIALHVSHLLNPYALTRKSTKTYIAKDFMISGVEHDDYIGELGSRLIIEEDDSAITYKLTATAPLELGNKRILEHFQYSFTHARRNKLTSKVTLALASSTLPRLVLAEYLNNSKDTIDPSRIGQQALRLLQGAYQAA